jgi:formamidopyrimidine-DNA glycosylase
MPELPEVETIRRGLAPALVGRRIEHVLVREVRLRTPVAPDFARNLTGRRLEGLDRHGKFLLGRLDDGAVWLLHLGMSGQLTLSDGTPAARLHDHVLIRFEGDRLLAYNDPRRFGRIALVRPEAVATEAGVGIDALAVDLDAATLFRLTRGRRTSLKALLMDQRRIAGLGNIYVSELLFQAGVRPRRAAGRVSRADCDRIVAAMRAVLAEAIACGGSSISDYRDGFGSFGCFQSRHQVYDRVGEACHRCQTPIRGMVVVGRSTFFCPHCQR